MQSTFFIEISASCSTTLLLVNLLAKNFCEKKTRARKSIFIARDTCSTLHACITLSCNFRGFSFFNEIEIDQCFSCAHPTISISNNEIHILFERDYVNSNGNLMDVNQWTILFHSHSLTIETDTNTYLRHAISTHTCNSVCSIVFVACRRRQSRRGTRTVFARHLSVYCAHCTHKRYTNA